MVKSASLTSDTVGSVTLVIRIRAWVVALPVTVQLNRPSLAVLALMSDQEAPPFREIWIFTLPVTPLEDQRGSRKWSLACARGQIHCSGTVPRPR